MSIYLNAGGHGLPSAATLARQLAQLQAEARDGPDVAAAAAGPAVGQVRDSAARLLGVDPAQVALGHTTSQFWLAAVTRLPLAGRRVLVAPHEWGNHVRYLQRVAPALGLTLDVIPTRQASDPAAWAARIDADLAAIVLPHVTSAQGLVYPVAQIGALPRPDDALLIVDAAQSVGRVPATLPDLNCDVLVATARKWLRGPRATAMMALSPRAAAVLGPAASLEPMDVNVALRLGLGAALDQALEMGIPAVAEGLDRICAVFRDRLAQDARLETWLQAGLTGAAVAPGHLTLSIPTDHRAGLDARLAAAGIVPKWADPAHEEPLAQHPQPAPPRALLRITPHHYNTAAQAQALAAALRG